MELKVTKVKSQPMGKATTILSVLCPVTGRATEDSVNLLFGGGEGRNELEKGKHECNV